MSIAGPCKARPRWLTKCGTNPPAPSALEGVAAGDYPLVARRQVDVQVEYIGFSIEDRFVVGYGLDYAEQYRNLPYITVLGA